MTKEEILTWIKDSFRLRPFCIGIVVGLIAPYIARLLGWAL